MGKRRIEFLVETERLFVIVGKGTAVELRCPSCGGAMEWSGDAGTGTSPGKPCSLIEERTPEPADFSEPPGRAEARGENEA